MEVKKEKSQFGPSDIVVTEGEKKYKLFFGGDGDGDILIEYKPVKY